MRHWARYQTEVKRLYEVLEKRFAEVKAPLASPNQLNTALKRADQERSRMKYRLRSYIDCARI